MRPRGERNRLSRREEEVLRLAANGMTDQQIANTLSIKVSTVTTYWVRIRSKVGQLSRAELISLAIRQKSQEAVNELRAEIARLKQELAARQEAEREAQRSARLAWATLETLSLGVTIIRPDGGVQQWNRAAEGLLGPDVAQRIAEALGKERARREGTWTDGNGHVQQAGQGHRVETRSLDSVEPGWRACFIHHAEPTLTPSGR